jgi:hypothetical protein
MKLLKDRIAKWSMVSLLTAFAATSFYAPNAAAHGEKSQASLHAYAYHSLVRPEVVKGSRQDQRHR